LDINLLEGVALPDPKRLAAMKGTAGSHLMGSEVPMNATQERRISRRTRLHRNAAIILNDRSAVVQCTLLDLSRTGARLSVSSTYKLSEAFELTFDNGRTRRKCRVQWRTDTKLGVTFEYPGN
jgi:hypothetical protein